MSNKTNDEKLRILQERLAQIKQKQEAPKPQEAPEIKEEEIPVEVPAKESKPLNLKWIKYVAAIGVLGYGAFYLYNTINFNAESISSKEETEEVVEENTPKTIEYSLNLNGNNIAITSTFEDKGSAKAMVNDLKVKGFDSDYFYLPNNSNSTEKVYKVFIGPYESMEEANQWTNNLDTEFEIIEL